MPEYRKIEKFMDNFSRAQAFTTTPGFNGWTIHDTSSSGTPTYLVTEGTGATLTCDNTSEAQVVCLYQNDVKMVDVDLVDNMTFLAEVSGVDSVTTIVMGLGSARNSTADSVAANAWFRIEGSGSTSALLCESDDGTTDYDDKATGATLSSTTKKFVIDFSNGKSDIRFFVDGVRVAASTTFTLAAYTGLLQPIFQVQKASGTGVPALAIQSVEITYKRDMA